MKNKKIQFWMLLLIMFFVGIGTVKAKTIYTAYEPGNRITANVSSDKQVDFFIVKQSGTDSDRVLALTYDFVGDIEYTFNEAQALLNTTKSNWNNAISVNIPNSEQLIGQTVELEDENSKSNFTSPSWVSPKTNSFVEYWLADEPFSGSHAVVYGMDTYYNSQFHIFSLEDSENAYVKFIVEISKEDVVGGTTISEIDDLNITFKYSSDVKNTYRDVYLNLKSNKYQDNDYRALFSKENNNIPDSFSDDTKLVYMEKNIQDTSNYIVYGDLYFEYAAMYGDVYLTIYEYDGTNFVKTSKTYLVKRLDYLPYSYRIVSHFFNDNTAQFKVNDIHIEEQKIKFKIGEVNDLDLLTKFVNPNNESYESLLKYAKEDSKAIFNSAISLNKPSDVLGFYSGIYDSSKVTDGKYYYVYTEIDEENGKYYPLYDVQLYISKENGSLLTSNYKEVNKPVENPTDDNINKPNVETGGENVDKPLENPPQTGTIAISSLLVVGTIGGIVLYLSKKKNKVHKI